MSTFGKKQFSAKSTKNQPKINMLVGLFRLSIYHSEQPKPKSVDNTHVVCLCVWLFLLLLLLF